MSSYFINNTSGTMELIVNPGELNGVGGKVHSTDLRLYGMGAIKWGEGVDENFVKLLESFSCPQKEDGDEWFGESIYSAADDRIWPKGQNDQSLSVLDPDNNSQTITIYSPGPGMGITKPINGQLWFNNSQKLLYIYDEFNKGDSSVSGAPLIEGTIGTWEIVSGKVDIGGASPVGPDRGDLWFNTGTEDNVCNENQLMIQDPVHPDANENGWVSVAANYVKKCGDTMTGELDMGLNKIPHLGDPSDDFDAVNKRFVEGNYLNKAKEDGDQMVGPLFLVEDTTSDSQTTRVLNQAKSDARYVKKSGDSMNGWLDLLHTLPTVGEAGTPAGALPHDYYPVPVALLRDYVGSTTGSFGQSALYYGTVVIDASKGGGAYTTFDFSHWKSNYEAKIGATVENDEFLVVAVTSFENLRVFTGAESSSLRSFVSYYGGLDYNMGPGLAADGITSSYYPESNNFCKVQVKLGPESFSISRNRQTNYSLKSANAKARIHFFGGPRDVLWNYDENETISPV